jgi:short-subunit dehydrogenase
MPNAVITGATKGIGRAVSFALAKEGFNLLYCARTDEDLRAMNSELSETFPDQDFRYRATDLSRPEEVDSFAEYVQHIYNKVDVLVNNAGIFEPGSVIDAPSGQLESNMQINVYSGFYLTKALLPGMIQNGSGHIFNMCSVASLMGYPGGASYCITKFAQLGFSRVLREELKETGVKVTALMPGATWSHSWKGLEEPRERLMEPEDVATALVAALQMGKSATMEEVIIRPQRGDL